MISPLTLLTVLVGLIPLLANAGKTVSIWSSGTRPEDLVKFTVENARWEGSLEIAEGYESTDNASNGRWWLKTWKDGQASSAANRQPVEVRFTADLGSKLQLGIVNVCQGLDPSERHADKVVLPGREFDITGQRQDLLVQETTRLSVRV